MITVMDEVLIGAKPEVNRTRPLARLRCRPVLSNGGAIFAAFVIATMPMFILVGFTMRYFVSGLTEGATKL
jgi:ABC-type glycerol-3-phosphate transport system permease component